MSDKNSFIKIPPGSKVEIKNDHDKDIKDLGSSESNSNYRNKESKNIDLEYGGYRVPHPGPRGPQPYCRNGQRRFVCISPPEWIRQPEWIDKANIHFFKTL